MSTKECGLSSTWNENIPLTKNEPLINVVLSSTWNEGILLHRGANRRTELWTDNYWCSLVPRPLPVNTIFLRVTLKNWEWPGDEAILVWCTVVLNNPTMGSSNQSEIHLPLSPSVSPPGTSSYQRVELCSHWGSEVLIRTASLMTCLHSSQTPGSPHCTHNNNSQSNSKLRYLIP